MSLPFTQIAVPQDASTSSNGVHDWVGVQGEWMVSFCFCDHRVLQVYNNGIGPGLPADTSIFEADDFQEVFRNMKVELHVLRTEPDPEYPDKPVIFFAGVMKDLSQSIMNGQVWMTSEGHVRWHFVSGEQNNAIWRAKADLEGPRQWPPKPPIEKPKWKPPPVIASPPPDDDDDQPREAPNLANIIKSPPLPPSSEIVEKASGEGGEKEEEPSAERDETAEPDPEEEERQRRAAIAARMARLGGTRVGMAPPVFGKRPPPPPKKRSSTSEDVLASESSKESATSPRLQPTAEESKPPEAVLDRAIVSPPTEAAAEPGLPPQPSDSQSAKSPPSSMPVPAVPRRAAPPRRKPQKPTAPPPPVPETEGEKEPSPTSHDSLPSHDIAATELAEQVEQVQLTPGSPPAISGKAETTAEVPSAVSEAPAIPEVPKEPPSESEAKEAPAQEKAEPVVEGHDEHETEAPGEADPEPEPELDEETRRRQVAERIAKMGGINPFAAQLPPRRQSSRIEEPAENSEEPAPPKGEQPVVASSPEQTPSLPPIEAISPPLALAEDEQADESDVAVPVPPRVQDSSKARAPSPTIHEPTNLRELPKEADDNDSDESEYEDEDESVPKPVSAGLSRREERLEEDDDKRVPVSESSPSIPVPPPRAHPHRAVPPPPEAETVDESDSENEYEDMSRSQILSRSEEKEKGISKDNDSDDGTPLPIPPRASRSIDAGEAAATLTRSRTGSDASLSGLDEDEQEPLPVRPPATFTRDAPSPERDAAPLFVPPPPPTARPPPPPATRGLPPAPSTLHESSSQSSLKVPTQTEVLDDDEGDPIDPSFHSPSRRASAILPASTTIVPPDDATSDNEASTVEQSSQPAAVPEEKEDPEAARRRTIADRMAKLGGIKFGAAPPVPGQLNKRPPPVQQHQVEESAPSTEEANVPQSQEELTEEEEERARKERIAAKLAGMGGMRIGMMPTAFPPRKSHALSEKASSAPAPAPPAPSRPPPPPQAPGNESEYEGSTTSEDAVKVEAEESEIEEVNHEDVQEEIPPPIPSRAARASRRESSELPSSPPPIPRSPPMASSPPARPPVPAGLPARRPSTQTIGSQRRTSGDSGYTPSVSQRKSSVPKPHSEYVMVEEPQEEEAPPPLPPNRPAGRAPPPPTRSPPPAEPKESISSQWELPTIPTSTLTLEGDDLSMSWTEADAEPSSAPSMSSSQTYQHVASPPQPAAALVPRSANDVQLSSDDLMAVWGRVGVQVCEVATTLFERSKKGLIGDGTYPGYVRAVVKEVPNAVLTSDWGYLIYKQSGASVQKRASEIMPGDLIELHDAKLKGHKGLQAYHQNVGADEPVIGVISEFEPKKSKIKAFHANQHVGQQTVESISYRLEDLKSGTVKIYRVLEA
ncbi:hypothetical protein H1R20_g2605, partial [Candolleomyces eurysporus]